MPYQEVNVEGKRVLCRTENFANSHAGFDSFLRGQRATSVLQQLAGEEMFLFKEKINYKLAGSGGFDPHIDANVYTHVKNIKHLTILAAVDNINAANGGLEVVSGSHRLNIPLGGDRCIASDWVESNVWTPAELDSGGILIFGSYLAHRSGANVSSKDRRAIYATYNCAAEGDLHDQYYSDRQKPWPATHMRESGKSYEEGRVRYAFGSPMLTVDSLRSSRPDRCRQAIYECQFQGGPFRGADLKGFEEDPLRDDMVSLRRWDDAAKLEGIEAITPRAGAYLDMIVTYLLHET
ncbi:Phytanoyl-CoA dioxygenase [Penicillium cf. griseofulvum]|nr:Phytanoyl-CoA dioxygenase [Penicillium cf. griseofulvum]